MAFNTHILHRAKAGDQEAIDQMMEDFRPLLIQMARRLLSSRMQQKVDPEDIVQEVALQVVKSVEAIDADSQPQARAWLCTTLKNRVKNTVQLFTTSKRNFDREEAGPAGSESEPACNLVQQKAVSTPSQVLAYQDFLDRLSVQDRKIIELRSHGFALDEIAEAAGVSKRHVSRVLFNSLAVAQSCIVSMPKS